MSEYINIEEKNPVENGIYEVVFVSKDNSRFKDILTFKDGEFYDADPDWGLERVSYGKDILQLAPSIKAASWKKIRDLDVDD